MKSSEDPRHKNRVNLMQHLFSFTFHAQDHTADALIQPLWEHLSEIDAKITSAAPEWPVGKIAKIDLSVLRLAVYELTIEKKEPPKVIIDEAIELAKEYGNPNSPQFVNGVLGTIYKNV